MSISALIYSFFALNLPLNLQKYLLESRQHALILAEKLTQEVAGLQWARVLIAAWE